MKSTVTPEWVKRHLQSANLLLLDARSRGAYKSSHIPRAVHANFFHYFVPGTDKKGLEQFHEDLSVMLSQIGIRPGQTIIVYESGLGMRAARVEWMLHYAGLQRVSMMEGGYKAWKNRHYPTQRRSARATPTEFKPTPNPRLLATADEILALPKNALVLDVRSRGEFDGSEKRDCCERSGRIPGAVWHEWTEFLNSKGGFLSLTEFNETLPDLRVSRRRPIVTYCHRGARAASAFYALKSLGFNDVRNYVGSWHEWSSRRKLPVETGP